MDTSTAQIARDYALDPILVPVTAAAAEGPKRTVVFSKEGLEKVKRALDARRASPDFPAAVSALVAFAGYLDRDCRSPGAAKELLAIAVTGLDVIERRVAKLKAERSPEDVATKKAHALASFLGEVKRKSAPHLEGARPKGTLELRDVFRPRTITAR